PRELARGARRRARAVPEALTLLPLRRGRPAPPGPRPVAHPLPRRAGVGRGRRRSPPLRTARRRALSTPLGEHGDVHRPLARAVELAEEDALPRAERHRPVV